MAVHQDSQAYGYDGFVAKFSPAGALLWVTGVGDRCNDQARGLALDGVGNVYVTGQIGGICYPYPTLNSGAFVAKLSAQGAPRYILAFSDYWSGGSDVGQAVAVDSAGRAYVGGLTTSSAFPVTPGAFQQDFRGGADGFVVKVNATGTALLWSTFLAARASNRSTTSRSTTTATPTSSAAPNRRTFPRSTRFNPCTLAGVRWT